MNILAFDTSNQALALALYQNQTLLGEVTVAIKKNHSISLMPSIDFLVSACDLTPQDLDRIVVAQGPGSYTGLRVAAATAKTLAYALQIDLVGVSSLQALTDIAFDGLIVPLMDARRNNVYVGYYKNGQAVKPDGHASLLSVLDGLKDEENLLFVGEAARFREQIQAALPQARLQESLPSARLLAKLGQDLQPCDVDTFIPHYLKRVEAEENWLKSHQDSSAADYIKRV